MYLHLNATRKNEMHKFLNESDRFLSCTSEEGESELNLLEPPSSRNFDIVSFYSPPGDIPKCSCGAPLVPASSSSEELSDSTNSPKYSSSENNLLASNDQLVPKEGFYCCHAKGDYCHGKNTLLRTRSGENRSKLRKRDFVYDCHYPNADTSSETNRKVGGEPPIQFLGYHGSTHSAVSSASRLRSLLNRKLGDGNQGPGIANNPDFSSGTQDTELSITGSDAPTSLQSTKASTTNKWKMASDSSGGTNKPRIIIEPMTPGMEPDDEAVRVFPFQQTPSGNFKIHPQQIVFESKKVSVLVADPKRTRVNVKADMGQLTARPEEVGDNASGPYNEFKEDELGLCCLGGLDEPVDWTHVTVPEKTDLYQLLLHRITNNINPDTTVHIGNDQYLCHLLVLQCYSSFFDAQSAKDITLPVTNVTPGAFVTILEWMTYREPDCEQLLKKNNVLEVYIASKFLGIQELVDQCWSFMKNDKLFREDSAFVLYTDARKLEMMEVMELMIPRVLHFFLTLVGSKDFVELDLDELILMLRSNHVSVHSEMEVFMSAVRWLTYNWPDRRKHVVDVMSCVRFGLVAPWQLVDIRRNPENQEFIEVSQFPEVQQMIEDGLAYAIIKCWYGEQNDDFQHWVELLGLSEPDHRTWIGEDRQYVTYQEFLNDLMLLRNEHIQACQQRNKKLTAESLKACKAKNKNEANMEGDVKRASFNKGENHSRRSSRSSGDGTFPVYLSGETTPNDERNSLQRTPYIGAAIGSPKFIGASGRPFISQKPLSKADLVAVANALAKRNTPPSKPPEHNYEAENHAATVIQTAYRGYLARKNFKNQKTHVVKAQALVRTFLARRQWLRKRSAQRILATQDKVQATALRKISVSLLSPTTKNYLSEGSLFLPDREAVLVFGGVDPHTKYGTGRNTGKDIYRYIPESNSWEFAGELPEPRHHHGTAFLRGRIYIVGGADPRNDDDSGKSVVVGTMWSFEPTLRTWNQEESLLTPRKNFGLVVTSGKMYIIGGQDREGKVLGSVERYDPEVGAWSLVAPLDIPRMGVAVAKYRDMIWVAGGMTGIRKHPLSRNVECYDTKRNVWVPNTPLRFPRCFARFFVMSDSLYLFGGAGRQSPKDRSTASVAAVDVWDSKIKSWKLLTEMSIPRHGHSIAYIGTRMLIIGGVTTIYMRALNNVECYCTEGGIWTKGIASLPTSLSGHGSVVLPPASLM